MWVCMCVCLCVDFLNILFSGIIHSRMSTRSVKASVYVYEEMGVFFWLFFLNQQPLLLVCMCNDQLEVSWLPSKQGLSIGA